MKEVWIGLILLLLAGGVWYQTDRVHELTAANKQLTDDLESEKAAVVALRTKVPKAASKAQQDRIKVKEVLDEAPAFRDTVTPDPVRDKLCQVIHCK
ncbi:hypothetical protein [Pseudomonas phage Nerthus]|uniref:Uncharacterized protein n=1 Tax=Pseudomonas phage Nerthus TaxID=2163984 RepID=A0A2S1GMR6_9CAUD|nr:hypothetical protein HOT09_gp45 [Pseudomonas phage Nerthus]AWD90677.1 hypothetical protein [Pseudomonas phage Nerthus]